MEQGKTPQFYLATPMAKEFKAIRQHVAAALKSVGIEPVLIEEITIPGASFQGAALEAIRRSDCIIADLTGENPSVMYEVGFAQALRKPVIPIVQKGASVPVQVEGDLYLPYDPAAPDDLRRMIAKWAHRYLAA
jgi:nucleoside 2-deoxyribosyltransferase